MSKKYFKIVKYFCKPKNLAKVGFAISIGVSLMDLMSDGENAVKKSS